QRLGQLGERLPYLREPGLELGRAHEIRARNLALKLPLAQTQQEFRARPLVDPFLRRTSVELRPEDDEIGVVLAVDERGAEPPVLLGVEVLGCQLRQASDERGVRDAGRERIALETVAG